jgi:HK97 family phage major capsid protein
MSVKTFGDAIFATKMDDGNVKLAGYLVRFGDASKTDLTGDYFTKNTDFGQVEKSASWFNHRMPVEYKGKRMAYTEQLPDATLKMDEFGIFAEIVLGARNEYEKMIAEWGMKGLLGWSSGTAPHLVDRKTVGNATEILKWPLGLDASLTPTPAEPRNKVTPLKSISVTQDEAKPAPQDKREAVAEPETITIQTGVKTMELENEKLQEMLSQAAEAGAKKAIEATEAVKTSGGNVITVTVDESERPFKSLAEQAQAVKEYAISYGQKQHPRIKFLKAVQGASEGVPSDGGILLDPTLSPSVITPIHETGAFANDARKLPVSNGSNSGWINGVDETSRVAGSRWGGLRGYRLAEGDTVTKSKPTFRRINWELKKYGVLVYDTNELLKDASQFAAIAEQGCREEIAFMLNDDIFNGLGVSGPLGIMNSGALISVTRDTASNIKGTDISAMWQRLSLRSKANAKWYVNPDTAAQLDSIFAVGSTAVLFPYASYQPGGVRTLYGRPVIETEFNPSLNASGDILLADMGEYLLWEKGGVEMATSMHVEFLTDQEVIRFIYRCDGQPAAASATTPYKGSNTTSPFVVLGAASA